MFLVERRIRLSGSCVGKQGCQRGYNRGPGREVDAVLFHCCKSGVFGARRNGGGAAVPAAVIGNWMRNKAANIATELSLHSPPCPRMISFGTRTIQQGTRAFPV